MTRRSALGGGGGSSSAIGDIKYKALGDNSFTFESVNGQEWLRAGWVAPWDSKYSAAHAIYGRGLYGYSTATNISVSSFTFDGQSTMARVYWDGTRYYIMTAVGSSSAAGVYTMDALNGGVAPHTGFTMTGEDVRIKDLIVYPSNGRQVVAFNNGSLAYGSSAVYVRNNLGAWSSSLSNVPTSDCCLEGHPDTARLLLVRNVENLNQSNTIYRSDNQGTSWTPITPTGSGVVAAKVRRVIWSSFLSRFLFFYVGNGQVIGGSPDAGVITAENLGGGNCHDITGNTPFAESATCALLVARTSTNQYTFYRNTGAGWTPRALPSGSTTTNGASLEYCAGAFYYCENGMLWRSTDDGLSFVFLGNISGASTGSYSRWLGTANGQLFRVNNASGSIGQLQYFTQAAPGTTPDVVGYPFPMFMSPSFQGGTGTSHAFVRIF